MDKNKKALVLVSGGLDSTTLLKMVINSYKFDSIYAISFFYNQRHAVELEAVKRIINSYGIVNHKIINLELGLLGGSSLTDMNIKVPKNDTFTRINNSLMNKQVSSKENTSNNIDNSNIPNTYVPGRNTIFLSYAMSYAEIIGAYDIFIGANAVDYSGYPDCRPEYIEKFNELANLATKRGVSGEKLTIHAPLISMSKAEIITIGTKLGVDYSITVSCYDPDNDGNACGKCDACLLRMDGFKVSGIEDPTRYKIKNSMTH